MDQRSNKTVWLTSCIALVLVLTATAPLAAQAFRFVTTCDAQGNSDANPNPPAAFTYIVNAINALNPRPDFWIFGGDAFYSATDSATAAAHWQTFLGDADPLSDIQLYVAIGNHDINNYGHYYGPWHGDGTGAFKATFPGLPQNGPTGYAGVVYSFRFGNSIFCVVNTNLYSAANYGATYKVDATQRAWLSAVLDTTTAVHKFVIGHSEAWPPDTSSSSLQWNASDRDAFWQVLTSHHVEAYICGHIHLWNRDYFKAASAYGLAHAPSDTTTRQIVCGGAGGSLVGGYGGKFHHFVVWDINGSAVTARVLDSLGAQRDSFGWSTPSGVASGFAAGTPRPMSRIRYYGGAIHWDGSVGRATVSIYDITGCRVWAATVRGNNAAWSGQTSSGVYLVKVDPAEKGEAPLLGKIVILH